MQRSRAEKLLDGRTVWVSPGIQPKKEDIQELVLSAGGEVLKKEPETLRDDILIISSQEAKDKRSNQNLKKLGYRIFSKDLLLDCVLKQDLVFKDEFLIK